MLVVSTIAERKLQSCLTSLVTGRLPALTHRDLSGLLACPAVLGTQGRDYFISQLAFGPSLVAAKLPIVRSLLVSLIGTKR